MNGAERPGRSSLRVWRLRKRNLYVDAELRPVAGPDGVVELLIYYGASLSWSGRFDNRSDAINEARARRSQLEREGWNFHW